MSSSQIAAWTSVIWRLLPCKQKEHIQFGKIIIGQCPMPGSVGPVS